MTTELLRPDYSNISCTEDQCALSGAVMSTERKETYISIQREHSIPFKQLLVKEIFVNGPWRLYGSTALIITKLAKYVTISVFLV